MESLLGYKNPLYGRKTGHIKLDFLKFRYFKDFFPRYDIEENISKNFNAYTGKKFENLISPYGEL